MIDEILRRRRPALVAATGAVVIAAMSAVPALAASMAAAPAPAAPAAAITGAGEAYGTMVTVGSTVSSGPSSLITFGCGTPAKFHTQNSVASVALGSTLHTGTVATSGDTAVSPTRTVTSARTQNVSLLGGLVTATAINAVSTVSSGSSGYQTSAAGSTFAGLKVAGVAVSLNAKPNTTIALPGLGRIVINEQIRTTAAKSATFTVNGLHIKIDQLNLLGLATGTDIVVSHARSTLSPPQTGSLTGVAYGSQATVGAILSSGPTFPATLPCAGTNGAVVTSSAARVTVPKVLTLGSIVDTARGSVTKTGATGQTTSTIKSANLLNGLVTATGIKAVATATRTAAPAHTTLSDAGSTIASITVNGRKINPATVGKNTRITVAGVGTLWLHRTVTTGNQLEVRMIELDVTTGSIAGIATGTSVYVGVARVGAN